MKFKLAPMKYRNEWTQILDKFDGSDKIVLKSWASRRPLIYTWNEHLDNPLVNCIGEGDKMIAKRAMFLLYMLRGV